MAYEIAINASNSQHKFTAQQSPKVQNVKFYHRFLFTPGKRSSQ